MAEIDVRIENWKKRLLDLGKRNRLINYKETKRSNIKIISPDLADLYETLVTKEIALSFPQPLDEYYDEYDEESYGAVSYGDIETDRNIKEQQKTLSNLRAKAKTAIEEQGINILYLCFGFLKWKESQDSDQIMISPIILVPVTLMLESISSPFELNLHDDEIVVNPTLIYKMENDFGIILPEFDSHEDDIMVYLQNINDISFKNHWEVVFETGLSLLSFLKINMYKDLDKNKEKIQAHSILKALSGETSQLATLPDEYNNYDHDNNIRPIDTYQIVDADSSQQDAILYSKKGISFVLQGPPGTGKSQTITNIIAESLADGKKVLFVSEKMAALEVVYKRLAQAGLADFCLTLHSHKANKKEVLNELGKTLSMNKVKLQDEAFYQLESLEINRDRLNKYNTELHTICQPLNKSIYDINGKLAKLHGTPDVVFSLEDAEGISSEKLNKYTYLLAEYSKTLGKMTEDYSVNPWRGCKVPNVSHELRHDIETYLKRLAPKIQVLAETYDAINNGLDLNRTTSMNAAIELIDILELSSKSPKVPTVWIFEEDISPLIERAGNYRDLQAEYKIIQDELSAKYTENFFELSAGYIQQDLMVSINKLKQYLNVNTFKNDSEIVLSARDTIDILENLQKILDTSISAIMGISQKLAINQAETYAESISLNKMLASLLLNPKSTEEWFDPDKYKILKRLFNEAKDNHLQLDADMKSVASRYDVEILSIDHSAMLKRFKIEYTSILKIFKKNYRDDKKLIRSLAKDLLNKIDDNTIIAILNELKEIGDKKAWIQENESLMSQLFGSHYEGIHTNWDEFENVINAFDSIIAYFNGAVIPLEFKELLLAWEANSDEIRSLYGKLASLNDSSFLNSTNHVFSESMIGKEIELTKLQHQITETLEILRNINELYTEITKYSVESISLNETMSNLKKLERLQIIENSIAEQSEMLKNDYQFLFNGINTDWDMIIKSLTWTNDFKKLDNKYKLSRIFVEKICNDTDFILKVDDSLQKLKNNLSEISWEWNWYINLFDNRDEFLNLDLLALYTRIEKCFNNIYSLEEWIDFRSCREECQNAGLTDFIEKIQELKIDKISIVNAFLKRFYRLWLDAFVPQFPAVNSFRRRSQEDTLREFNKLDLTQMSIARSRVKEILISRLPDLNSGTSAVDEVGILKRELNKQKKIMPLRRLFKTIPNLLLTLKPCLMMSPLSVSLFLEAENYNFDIIIFDEASQVCTEDAIGAIMRGSQVIIAGDSKQLPPTSFFAAITSDKYFDTADYNEDEYDDSDAYESILDEAVTVLPERTLKWHYRSRHEELIAFSNAKIYNYNLITFPSHIDRLPGNGVEYIYVPNGVYDRGGKKYNINEAKKVADLVFEHIKKYPNRSLGVVTFSEAQQQSVESAIRQLRLQNQQFESYFREDIEEAFFVKNLENVQGDERDTIIFSIGYAKDHNGIMYMNFGPLSKSGGYRRLNVAITRAKFNVKLVGSIHPTDIRLENTNSEGVKLLRSYIEFAINGTSVLQRELNYSNIVEVDSPFEESVYDFLVKHNYKVVTQVGCSGYRIDLAVKHPTLDNRFVLGIECDGATYHSARTARERDRLRQTVLEDIGWRIYRIWSTDWIKDPITEGQKLLETVEKAISQYMSDDFFFENHNDNQEIIISQEEFLTIDASVEQSSGDEDIDDNPYGFDYYEETTVYEIDRHPDDAIYLAKAINHVVQKEYPIHFELLCKRIAPLFGNQKATVKVRNSAEFVINNKLNNSVERRGDFCWLKGTNKVPVRIPQACDTGRKINYLSIDELAEAMFQIANKSIGITQEDLYVSTARVFGFNRTGGNISNAMQKACEYLIETGRVKNSGGKIIV